VCSPTPNSGKPSLSTSGCGGSAAIHDRCQGCESLAKQQGRRFGYNLQLNKRNKVVGLSNCPCGDDGSVHSKNTWQTCPRRLHHKNRGINTQVANLRHEQVSDSIQKCSFAWLITSDCISSCPTLQQCALDNDNSETTCRVAELKLANYMYFSTAGRNSGTSAGQILLP